MPDYVRPLAQLIAQLEQLPGLGIKSAERIAFHLIRNPEQQTQALAEALLRLKHDVQLCRICYNLSDAETCAFCADAGRDPTVICVVEEPRHLVALERAGEYRGLYHVLLGALAPLDGVGPEALKIDALMSRLRASAVREVILATDPDKDGEATAFYLAGLIKPLGVKVTRIASGVPVGGNLDYADGATLGRALTGRQEV